MAPRYSCEDDVRARAGGVPTGQIRLEARVFHQVGRSTDGDLRARARRLPGRIRHRHGDGVGARRWVAVVGARSCLGADRCRTVAEVEAVAGDRRGVSVAGPGCIGSDLKWRRARGGTDRQRRIWRRVDRCGADGGLRAGARRLAGRVRHRNRDGVGARCWVAVVGARSCLRADRRRAVAEVEAVAGDRRGVGVARPGCIGRDRKRRRARGGTDRQRRGRGRVEGARLELECTGIVIGARAGTRVWRSRVVDPRKILGVQGGLPART